VRSEREEGGEIELRRERGEERERRGEERERGAERERRAEGEMRDGEERGEREEIGETRERKRKRWTKRELEWTKKSPRVLFPPIWNGNKRKFHVQHHACFHFIPFLGCRCWSITNKQ
jgi:hypothetical protein